MDCDSSTMTPCVADLVRRLTLEKNLSLSALLEEMGPRLLSDSADEREKALEEVVDVITALPNDFLTDQQVNLLVDFLLGRLETSALAGGVVLTGIRHLVLNVTNLPNDLEGRVFHALFRDGNVQAWSQKDRLKQFEIFEWLVDNRHDKLSSLGAELPAVWVKAMGGERDPRCLVAVFRIFQKIATQFNMGSFVEDMFEVVACYFPVEFKPVSTQDSITSELLTSLCIRCLTAHPSMSAYTLMLIDEKMDDDDTTEQQKIDICLLITECTKQFPAKSLLAYLPSLLGHLRAIGLHPKSRGDLPVEVVEATHGLAERMQSLGTEAATKMANNMLDNSEPFILQAEMGLSVRGLRLLAALAEAAPAARAILVDKAIVWCLQLVQGDTVNAAGNKTEICQEGLVSLTEWVRLAVRWQLRDVLCRYESSLIASLDVARERTPAEAKTAFYNCAKEYLLIGCASQELLIRCKEALISAADTVELETERSALFGFVTTHAEKQRDTHDLLIKELPQTKNAKKRVGFVCASIVDDDTWSSLGGIVLELVAAEPESLSLLSTLSSRLSSDVLEKVMETVAKSAQLTSHPMAVAEVLQDLGLSLSVDKTEGLVRGLMNHNSNTKTILMLLAMQCEDVNILQGFLPAPNAIYTIVNRYAEEATVSEMRQMAVDNVFEREVYIAKGLILDGSPMGMPLVKTLLNGQLNENSAKNLLSLFDFESRTFCPQKNRLRYSPLWRQRVFYQVLPIYLEAVENSNEKSYLLGLIPSILKFASKLGRFADDQWSQLLPVFVDALKSNDGKLLETVINALPGLLQSGCALDALSGSQIVFRLVDALTSDSFGMEVKMSCLESLERLSAQTPRSAAQPLIPAVSRATTRQLGHKKRIVRQKAAIVRNTWEMLVTK